MCLIKHSEGGGGRAHLFVVFSSVLLQPFTEAQSEQLMADGIDDDRSTVHASYHIFNGSNMMAVFTALVPLDKRHVWIFLP